MSCHGAAAHFGIGVSTAINWVRRLRETGSVEPGQMGGHKPKSISGVHRTWLLERTKQDFTLRGLVAELAERGLKVDYPTVWSFVHDEKLIRAAGAKLIFLPKYSPDLNPIEQLFAKLKHLLRKIAARTVDDVCAALGQILGAFPPDECANYFRNSGYGLT
jgi:hypothetical protein